MPCGYLPPELDTQGTIVTWESCTPGTTAPDVAPFDMEVTEPMCVLVDGVKTEARQIVTTDGTTTTTQWVDPITGTPITGVVTEYTPPTV